MEIIRRNTEYAIRALVYMAIREGEVVSAKEIAQDQEIPIEFLHKILQRLARAGLVASHRGAQGGFLLSKPPEKINLLEVVSCLQGQPTMNRCLLGKNSCPRSPTCALKKNWLELEKQVIDFLAGITLRQLADQLEHLPPRRGGGE